MTKEEINLIIRELTVKVRNNPTDWYLFQKLQNARREKSKLEFVEWAKRTDKLNNLTEV